VHRGSEHQVLVLDRSESERAAKVFTQGCDTMMVPGKRPVDTVDKICNA
jgi:hypothetical protein